MISYHGFFSYFSNTTGTRYYTVPSNGLISSPFLGKTFSLSNNHEGGILIVSDKWVSKELARPL
jgi:hypothetical protein